MSDAHEHEPGAAFQQRQLTPAQNREREIRVKAIEALLAEKGFVSTALLDTVLDSYENDIGPLNGCRVVALAWTDPAYKARLLENGSAAIAELGFGGLQGEHLVVVENTPRTHNVIVCALCSCYPWPVLGLPPFWYKSRSYRSRVTGRPREVLREFGLELDKNPSGRGHPTTVLNGQSESASRFRFGTAPFRPAIWSCRSGRPAPSR